MQRLPKSPDRKRKRAKRDIVLLNAGATLYVGEKVDSYIKQLRSITDSIMGE